MMNTRVAVLIPALLTTCALSDAAVRTNYSLPERQVPVTLTAAPAKQVFTAGRELGVILTITNGLSGAVCFSTFATEPNAWNGETVNCELTDIYRDGRKFNLYRARPEVHPPLLVSGMGGRWIAPGESLAIKLDISKWRLRDGWLPGKYEVTFYVRHIAADSHVQLSVLSDPIAFEIRESTTE
jgi:hypothetical protein